MGHLAHEFHWSPSDLWEMDIADLGFWMERHSEILERLKKG
jgi:hypothetical protein